MKGRFIPGMRGKNLIPVVFLCAILLFGHATGINIQAGDCTISGIGESAECPIILDQVGSAGFSGYEITVGLTNPEIAEITGVKFPSWAGLNSRGKVPSDFLMLKGADGVNRIKNGDRNVLLATLTLRGDALGESGLQINVTRVEDESGAPVPSEGKPGKVTVIGSSAAQGKEDSPAGASAASTPVFSPIPTPPENSQDELPAITPWPEGGGASGQSFPVDTAADMISPTPTIESQATPPTGSDATPVGTPTSQPTASSEHQGLEGDGTLDPSPGTGALSIDSSPTGAGVFVDGVLRGTTPLVISLTPGTHTLLIEADDGRRWKGEITVYEGRTLALPPLVLVTPKHFTIHTSSGPHGSVFPSGETLVTEGESVRIIFLPDAGYALQDISLDGILIGPKDELELAFVSSDHEVEGIFAKIPSPAANFTANMTRGRAPLAVQFVDLSSGPVSLWDWDFGDGARSGEREPVHVYSGAGNYSVSLEVCGGGECDELIRDPLIHVLPEEPLEAEFTANVTGGQAPLHVLFRDVSTGTSDSRVWEFGDGTNATDADPLHVYSSPGVYTVRLTIRTGDRSDTAEKPGFIDAAPPAIGGSIGYIRILGNVEGAKVYFDADFKGSLSNGVLVVPVYITATPYRMINVRAEGYIPWSTPLTRYPEEGGTIDYTVTLEPYFRGGASFNRSLGNGSVLNLTTGRPIPDARPAP